MKSLISFLKSSNEKKSNTKEMAPFDYIYNVFMNGAEKFAQKDPKARKFVDTVKQMINKFIDDNKITSIKQIGVMSSSPEYWEERGAKNIEPYYQIEDDDPELLSNKLKFSYNNAFSCEITNNRHPEIRISSKTDKNPDSVEFDAIISKNKIAN